MEIPHRKRFTPGVISFVIASGSDVMIHKESVSVSFIHVPFVRCFGIDELRYVVNEEGNIVEVFFVVDGDFNSGASDDEGSIPRC